MQNRWYWWVLGIVLVLVLLTAMFQLLASTSFDRVGLASQGFSAEYDQARQKGYGSPNFAPEVSERLITRTVRMSAEVERGDVPQAMETVRGIARGNDVIVLAEDYSQSRERDTVSYTLKVPVESYDVVVAALKQVGEVQRFDQDADDITGRVKDLQLELTAERERLTRLQALSANRPSLSDKLELETHIFDQQRRIFYLESELEERETRIAYSTVTLTVKEKSSAIASLSFVGFDQLVATFVGSIKVLLYILAALLPWALIGFGIWRAVVYLRR